MKRTTNDRQYTVHHSSDIKSLAIGKDTRIWQFCVIYKNAIIGSNCNISANVLIENIVRIGNNVTVKSGVQIWDGVTIEDDVFVGPNVTFTNDLVPKSKHSFELSKTLLKKGCSIGANSTIISGHTIGEYAFIGAGSVVTKDIPPNTIWYGNPAKQKGYITRSGLILDTNYCDKNGIKHKLDEIVESQEEVHKGTVHG